MPDGSNLIHLRPALRVVEQSPAGRHVFSAPKPPRFTPADPGAVYLGTTRLGPEVVEGLLKLFAEEAAWDAFDALSAASDGLTPEPPRDAA